MADNETIIALALSARTQRPIIHCYVKKLIIVDYKEFHCSLKFEIWFHDSMSTLMLSLLHYDFEK